ncbi:putative uroporphyrin-III c-methyltransferase [Candidatus Hodgkinia cicadicola Dsem]|nr:putative uroporphyrin-III c-methyltransferase [Candidatus Hodgkinia cicadicola Dsem]
MLAIAGLGPGSVHLLTLACVLLLEASQVVMVESLVNRSVLNAPQSTCSIKYVGRGVAAARAPLFKVLCFGARLAKANIRVVWAVNGDACLFNRRRLKRVFAKAVSAPWLAVSGVACAHALAAADSLAVAGGDFSGLSLECKPKLSRARGALIVHMVASGFWRVADELMCAGAHSARALTVARGVSLKSQAVGTLKLESALCVVGLPSEGAPCLLALAPEAAQS